MPEADLIAPARVLYLHGFASSARSTKAAYFDERLRAHGVPFRCPDFNEPDFKYLTMTRMLRQLETELRATASRPRTLIGSSLGGTLAILAAARLLPRRPGGPAGAGGDVRQAWPSPAARRSASKSGGATGRSVLSLRVGRRTAARLRVLRRLAAARRRSTRRSAQPTLMFQGRARRVGRLPDGRGVCAARAPT